MAFRCQGQSEPVPAEDDAQNASEADTRRSVSVLKTMDTQKKMRLLSQAALDWQLDWHMEPGCAYHIISAGDVDSLTYLRHIVRQQRCTYVLLSTWCMALADAQEMRTWVERGFVKRFDFYDGGYKEWSPWTRETSTP